MPDPRNASVWRASDASNGCSKSWSAFLLTAGRMSVQMLAELGVPGYVPPATPDGPRVEIVDIDQLLSEYSRK